MNLLSLGQSLMVGLREGLEQSVEGDWLGRRQYIEPKPQVNRTNIEMYKSKTFKENIATARWETISDLTE